MRAAVTIESARSEDVEYIAAIDQQTLHSRDAERGYRRDLEAAHAAVDVIVDTSSGQRSVLGFVNYWLVADELQIISLAVTPKQQRLGYGRALLDHVLAVGKENRVSRVTIEVRRSNVAAIGLYQSAGFETVGVRSGYYAPEGEDALIMNLDRNEELRDGS